MRQMQDEVGSARRFCLARLDLLQPEIEVQRDAHDRRRCTNRPRNHGPAELGDRRMLPSVSKYPCRSHGRQHLQAATTMAASASVASGLHKRRMHTSTGARETSQLCIVGSTGRGVESSDSHGRHNDRSKHRLLQLNPA